ncbi:MAG: insulinase family protein [Candidatus Dormibacteria bacterium]
MGDAAGTMIGGYRVLRTEPVQHVEGQFVELLHERTGARHFHVASADDNNAFAVAFPTVPTDSSGVAHILEHVVLAGSRKYPVRDPFFSMQNRSLATFMNAFTGGDVTIYPFSTRNRTDYFNLLDVYLDATFYPRLAQGSFLQEGHRLEFNDLDDPASGLRHKGVVFNEMKGARSAPPSILGQAVGEALFPNLTYAYDSGGDPGRIVDLTWEQLKAFHASHYHPSAAYFFTAGDIPLEDILPVIERDVLQKFEQASPPPGVGDQPPFDSPLRHPARFAIAADADTGPQAQALVAWATVPSADTYEVLKMRLLTEILIGNPGAPLRRALVESGVGEALADMSGFHDNFKQAVFAVGLKGISEGDADRVQALVLETLARLADEGLESELVEAALHQFEIAQREVSNAGFPYSLRLAMQQVGPALYGGDPYRSLRFDEDMDHLNRERDRGPVLEQTIREGLLANQHRALVVLTPDQELEQQREAAELARLARVEASLSEAEKAEIVRVAQGLRADQEGESEDRRAILPDLALSEIPVTLSQPETRLAAAAGAPLHLFPQPTNGFIYFDLLADFSQLPDELKDDLALFAYAITRSGAAGGDYVALARRIEAYTGGIGAAAWTIPHADGTGFTQAFQLMGKALTRNSGQYAAIIRDLVGSVSFDPRRLKDLIAEYSAHAENSLTAAGTQYALSLAGASLSPRGALADRLGGLAHVRRLRALSALGEAALGGVVENLERIRAELFNRDQARLAVTAEAAEMAGLQGLAEEVVGALGTRSASNGHVAVATYPRAHRARTWAVPVAYNALVRITVPYTHDDAAPLQVLAHLLREGFIHPEIREKGGAYGGQVIAGTQTGSFAFGSYRDPNVARTYEVFERAASFAAEQNFGPAALKGAVLGAARAIDPLESPDTRGRRRFTNDLAGFTLAAQQKFKANLLATTEADLHRVAATYLVDKEGVMATLGDETKINEANREMGDVFEVEPV